MNALLIFVDIFNYLLIKYLLADAEVGEDGVEDGVGGDGAGDGAEGLDGFAKVFGEEVGGKG